MEKVINPKTNYYITVNGSTFNKLLKEGYVYFDAINKLVKPPKKYETVDKEGWYSETNYGEIKESDVTTNIFCIPTNEEKKSMWRTTVKVGSASAFGNIWSACENSDCDFIIKYQKYRIDSSNPIFNITIQGIEREIKMQTLFFEQGLALPILDEWYCKDGASFVMRKLSMTIKQLLLYFETDKYRWIIFTELLELISRMHTEAGLYHGDLHLDNIMIHQDHLKTNILFMRDKEKIDKIIYDESNFEYYFIDLAFAGKLTKTNYNAKVKYDYQRLRNSFKYLFEALPHIDIFGKMKNILDDYVDKFI